ncbi:MAG: FliA/WhiG family RNA polymerase sigma factor, partial [Alicyclobacillus sp.]|nr:FliA/WhiG family RNA polymerase sigma factor [Alicyclobacillus sp.]
LTLREIGEVLGLSESQVSRIRTRALARLRARLGAEEA